MIDGEAVELLKHGYVRSYFISYYCRHCGSCRVMTAIPPDGHYMECPICSRAHCHFGLMGTGFTKRELPQPAEVWLKPITPRQLAKFLAMTNDETPDSDGETGLIPAETSFHDSI